MSTVWAFIVSLCSWEVLVYKDPKTELFRSITELASTWSISKVPRSIVNSVIRMSVNVSSTRTTALCEMVNVSSKVAGSSRGITAITKPDRCDCGIGIVVV